MSYVLDIMGLGVPAELATYFANNNMLFTGAWSPSTSYVPNNVVQNGGSTYICILANTNQNPPNGTYWTVIGGNTDASFIGYTPSGTGAVATTAGAWLTSAHLDAVAGFGADPTGVIDSTTALQSFLTACSGRTGYIPPGSYKITSALNILNKCTIQCVRGLTTLIIGTQNQNAIVIGDGTAGGRTTASGTIIDGLAFNPLAGITAFTSGSCVVRNNVYNTHVNNCDFYGYDSGAAAAKLWTSITDISTTGCNNINCTSNYMLGNVINVSGTSGHLASDCLYDYHQWENITSDAVAIGTYISGLTFEKPTAYLCAGWMFNINSSTGNNGQHIFILNPDLEMDGTGNGIYCQQCNDVQISGGWIGKNTATNPKLIWFGVNSSACCEDNVLLYGGSVVIDGVACSVGGGYLNGDLVNNTVGITISSTAIDTIVNPMRLGQFTAYGIQFTSTPPAIHCQITGVKFKDNAGGATATNIVGSTGAAGSLLGVSGAPSNNPPVVKGCSSDFSYVYAAGASGAVLLDFGREAYQVTASANITSMTNLTTGFKIFIQAGSGGIAFANGGNIVVPSSPLSVAAFKTVSFWNDGQFWFHDGQDF